MTDRRSNPPRRDTVTCDRPDDGSVLILVLVLIVVAGLIVLPLMQYTMSVLRLNRAVSERTQDIEAAKGGIRVAMSDPLDVFHTCDGGGVLTSTNARVNDHVVDTTCAELDEIGPLEALGFEVPVGAAAVQVGAEVRSTFVGTSAQSDPITPYPASADWWSSLLPVPTGRPPAVLPDDVVEQWDAKDGSIWLPELPRWPSATRSATPFDMPPAFNCKVFFPGQYTDPIDLTTGNIYFASGVYYFDDTVTIGGNANVIVGYGLVDFGSNDCADDLQVAANVISGPATFSINGGGATWVFGGDGRLIVDDVSGSPTIRFNQRYANEDRGGRVSIMTVNGDASGTAAHDVPFVSSVPLSRVLDTTDPDPANDVSDVSAILAGTYVPSSTTFTDAARLTAAPSSFTAEARQYDDGGTPTGALLLTWDPLTGNAGGGSPIEDYEVTVTPADGAGCAAVDDLVVTRSGPISCLITGLTLGTTYNVSVAGVNAVGAGATSSASDTPTSASAAVTVPDAPSNVTVEETADPDEARITWDAPAFDGGADINRYEVTAERIYAGPGPNLPPVAANPTVTTSTGTAITVSVPAYDPNGDPLTLTIDAVPPGWTATVSGLDVTLTPDASITSDALYSFPFTVTDTVGGGTATGVITMDFHAGAQPNLPPVAEPISLELQLGVPLSGLLPAYDPNGDSLLLDIDETGFDPGQWTFAFNTGLGGTVTTTAADGTYTTTYTVTDTVGGGTATGTISLTVSRPYEVKGTCEVVAPASIATTPASPIPTWYELPTTCDIAGLAALTGPNDLGYRFRVVATNPVGDSVAELSAVRPPTSPFIGGGTPTAPAPLATFLPWVPEPIIDIRAGGIGAAVVHVAGYVSVPMGQIRVTNPSGDDIELIGGVLTGTFDVNDARGASGDPETVPIGFRNDIVLQRKIRITAASGNARATAVVQINEDGNYRINTWVVN